MTKSAPLLNSKLIQGELNSALACLTKPLNGLALHDEYRVITRGEFLQHVLRLAELLPDQQYAINLCDNRYLFLVSTWAVIVRQQTNLLPPNKNALTQGKLAAQYADSYIIHDADTELSDAVDHINISAFNWRLTTSNESQACVPEINAHHPAIISFTSGSTGESKPNLKTWQTLEQSSAINAKHMLPNLQDVFYHLATVPGQHMWGLETSVLLPVFANACLVDARPQFPLDIITLIHKLPKPISLIGTPLHLRALALADKPDSQTRWANTLCATAPLSQTLAQQMESQFGTQVREVYGCSEVGSMAVRRSADTHIWQQFDGLTFEVGADNTQVSAPYLPAPVILEDVLERVSPNQFKLSGRLSDQIKVAGKRGSLHEVNHVLSSFSGAIDGVVIFPEQDRLVPRLIAMVVLKEGVDKTDLRHHFRQHLDAAFVPRPIYVVDSLPREENGKLANVRVRQLYTELSRRSR